MWELLSLCSYVRNELVHSRYAESEAAERQGASSVLAVTESERQKQSVRTMTDTQMVTSAIYHCGSLIVIATQVKVAAEKKAKPEAK